MVNNAEITAPGESPWAQASLVIRLLGAFDVRVHEQRLAPLRTHKGEWLLALLVLHRERPLQRDWLAGLLWPDSPDDKALYNMRRCLSDLRQALGAEAERIQTPTSRTVTCDLSGSCYVDVFAFDEDCHKGKEEPASLERAVAVYGGPLLEGCNESWVISQRAPREESYLIALEHLSARAIQHGDRRKAIACLRRLISAEPARESAYQTLMEILAASGDFAAVTQIWRELRVFLREELNTEPTPETKAVYQNLCANRPEIVSENCSVAEQEEKSGSVYQEPVGGAVPLNSPYYVERSADRRFQQAIGRSESIVLVKGPRQVGKTSLLARGLQHARALGSRVVVTDFQKLAPESLQNPGTLFQTLITQLADQLAVSTDITPRRLWDDELGPNENLERFLRRDILKPPTSDDNRTLVWGLDEVDRLFTYPFGSDVFALFRAWHNERALDPSGPWGRLTLALAYATEAHLFITDLNQSPFNVGTRLVLHDFTPEQITALNQRYAKPLNERELTRFTALVGGHPYLVRRGFYALTAEGMTLAELERVAIGQESPFNDHLRRLLFLLRQDELLRDAVITLLISNNAAGESSTKKSPLLSHSVFYRLSSAGVLSGDSPEQARFRCSLYATYLERNLYDAISSV